jgi:Carboxypeptidase regulatory-like domain/TonB dependent receptor
MPTNSVTAILRRNLKGIVVTNVKKAILFFTLIGFANAQAPTGTIAGVARDPSGAAVAGAQVKLANLVTSLARSVVTSEQGDFSFLALLAGEYEVSVQTSGFQRMVRQALVEAGLTTTTDFEMRVGEVKESVTVEGASPQMQYDSHSVAGVVTQGQIENLPLNGRSFLELAKLEPGVQPPSRASNRMFVPVLGAPGGNSGRGTRVTIDGGTIMAGLSQEAVQEFQISTVNFDLSTGLTFSGAINVVTRSGGNDLHGAAFYFFRDHKLAAYPALNRDPASPDPFFQRRQFGFALGGPIRRDRIFFFANWERNEQRGVADTTLTGDFAHFSGITPSPLFGDQVSLRLDARLSNAHTAFLRFSHDGNRAFGPGANQSNAYPSTWLRQLAWSDQSLLGLTSVLRPTLVNDLRFSYFFISSSAVPPREQDCPGCLGIGAPTINVQQAGLSIGESTTVLSLGRRFHLNDSATWQRGTHRARFGVDWEHNRGGSLSWANEPVTMTLFSPDQVRAYNARSQTPANLRIPLSGAFNTLGDVLSLPLQSFTLGIGDPRVPQENGGTTRAWNTARLFLQDSWRLHDRLTLNYGLAWNVDRNQNYDLTKPALLAPILGIDGLGPTRKQWKNFSPSLGLAWAPSHDGKTVIRAGAGIFYDFLFQQNLDNERALLGTPGLGRQTIPGSN